MDAGSRPTTETFRLRGGAGNASSESDDTDNWYTPEESPFMQPYSDHDRIMDSVQAMDIDDDAPGTNHATERNEDPDRDVRSYEVQRHPGYDDTSPQLLWRNRPNSGNVHTLYLSLAVTPSVSIEVQSEFLVSEILSFRSWSQILLMFLKDT